MPTSSLRFVHRSNQDGTIDSICRDCFATVHTAVWEAELEQAERDHRCDPMQVERFQNLGNTSKRLAS
jgi:hypothetical protein